ncbi:MAG: response regulator, partial [Bacteroidetes bacterium]|nr:response regulator [Bacteroidota bacterium]
METKISIWVVDDERIVRVTLADDLRDAGYNVKEFADASSAVTLLSSETPDLIITDLKMPGIDGIELLKEVKKLYPEIAVLLMTAYGTVENAVE